MFTSIKSKFLKTYIFYVIIIVSVGGVFMHKHGLQALVNITMKKSMELTKLQSEIIGTVIRENLLLLNYSGKEILIKNMSEKEAIRELAKIREISIDRHFDLIFINKKGQFINEKGDTGNIDLQLYFPSLKSKTKNKYYLIHLVLKEIGEKPFVLLGVPLFRGESFEGIAAMNIKLDKLSSKIQSVRFKGNSYVWLTDGDGLLMAHPNETCPYNASIFEAEGAGYIGFNMIADEMTKKDIGFGHYYDSSISQKKTVTFSSIPYTDNWKLCITTFQKDILKELNFIWKQLTILGLVVIITLAFITIKLTNAIIKPIKKLSNSVKESMNGNFEILELNMEEDELGQLVKDYNKMIVGIASYSEKLNDLNEQLKQHNNILCVQNESLYDEATRDPLTKLFNRRELNKKLEEICRDIKTGYLSECSILFFDLDNFKFYNDAFGHDIGDKILQYISNLLMENTRSRDFIARYGGDEFVALLIDLNSSSSEFVKDKLIHSVERLEGLKNEIANWSNLEEIEIPKNKHLNISVGLLCITKENLASPQVLLKQADKKMYENKKAKKRKF